jgi:hypothetical protein
MHSLFPIAEYSSPILLIILIASIIFYKDDKNLIWFGIFSFLLNWITQLSLLNSINDRYDLLLLGQQVNKFVEYVNLFVVLYCIIVESASYVVYKIAKILFLKYLHKKHAKSSSQ